MSTLPGWAFDPRAIRMSPALARAWTHPFGGTNDAAGRLRDGLLSLWPIASSRTGRIAVRFLPGRSAADCPVVLYDGQEATTIAAQARNSLPALTFHCALSTNPRWDSFARDWRAFLPELEDIHAGMGGTVEAIAGLGELLAGGGRPADLDLGRPPGDGPDPVLGRVLMRLDPHPTTRAFRDRLELLRRGETVVAADADLGPWFAAAVHRDFTAASGARARARKTGLELAPYDRRLVDAMWRSLCMADAFDVARSGLDGHFPWPTGTKHEQLLRDAVGNLNDWENQGTAAPVGDSPRERAALVARSSGLSYDGLAHAEAAAELDELGEAQAAFDLLLAAAYWSRCRTGGALPPIRGQALRVAEREGWADLCVHLCSLPAE